MKITETNNKIDIGTYFKEKIKHVDIKKFDSTPII